MTWALGERRSLMKRRRAINRLRGHLTEIFPGLERELDLGNLGSLVLLTGYQTPAAIRRTGRRRLAAWLHNRKVCSAAELAAKAVRAAEEQHATIPGKDMTAHVVHSLSREGDGLQQEDRGDREAHRGSGAKKVSGRRSSPRAGGYLPGE